MLAVCLLLAVRGDHRGLSLGVPAVLAVLAVLALGTAGTLVRPARRPAGSAGWPAAWAAAWAAGWWYAALAGTALAVPGSGAARSPLWPFLLAPLLALGQRGATHLLAGLLVGATFLAGGAAEVAVAARDGYLLDAGSWLLAAGLLGAAAARWATGQVAPPPPEGYAAVRHVLGQLYALTHQLPGGLDAPSAADALLERCLRGLPEARGAVLVRPSGAAFVPLAVRGTRRVPWRTPLDEGGPLGAAWESGRPQVDVRRPDRAGRRRGSAVAALPLLAAGRPFGLVVLESTALEAFPAALLASLQELVDQSAPRLETALLFEEVRLAATVEVRDRLAREMHDGVAQEVAFLGYRLDDLRHRAERASPELGELVAGIRADLTQLVSDLRLSITDLRTTVRPDRGLGNALGTYLRAVCGGRDVVLNLSLHESAFRLPADQEVALLQAAQAFSQQARRHPDLRVLTVGLTVDPPSARLELGCNVAGLALLPDTVTETLTAVGATMTASTGADGGYGLTIEFQGASDGDERPSRRRPRPHPAGAAAGHGADRGSRGGRGGG